MIQITVTEPQPSDGMGAYFGNITTLGTLIIAGLALASQPLRAVDRRRRVAPDRLLPCANQASLGTERRGRF